MVSRRFLCWALLALVLVVGGALGPVSRGDSGSAGFVTGPSPTTDSAAADDGDSDGRPCVMRADCAGGGLFAGAGLLLAVAVAVPTIGAVVTVGRVRGVARTLHSALVAHRLYRPPQFT